MEKRELSRRDFLKLAFTALAGGCLPKGKGRQTGEDFPGKALGVDPIPMGDPTVASEALYSSLSMVVDFMTGNDLTPGQMEDRLVSAGALNLDETVNWQFAGEELGVEFTPSRYYDGPVDEIGLQTVIDSIDADSPVLTQVDADLNTPQNEPHWVAVIGYKVDGDKKSFIYLDPRFDNSPEMPMIRMADEANFRRLCTQFVVVGRKEPVGFSNGTGGDENIISVGNEAIAWPLRTFIVTQGLHGGDYGQSALDMLACEDQAMVLAPFNGEVREIGVDEWENPYLILEGKNYRARFLHFFPETLKVAVGDRVQLGQTLAQEGNVGNVFGFRGRCTPEEKAVGCGEHLHFALETLNGQLINPFAVLPTPVNIEDCRHNWSPPNSGL